MFPAERPDPPRTLAEATAQLDALWGVVGVVREQNEALRHQNDDQRAQVQELLDRLDKHSGNSSKPPSSDSTTQKKNRPSRSGTRGKSSRKKGAQPGHPKHERATLPESEVEEIHRHFPPALCGCGTAPDIDAEPACRHQVFDLPVVRYTCAEHQLFGGCCPGCGERHVARAPQRAPSGQMGPGLVA